MCKYFRDIIFVRNYFNKKLINAQLFYKLAWVFNLTHNYFMENRLPEIIYGSKDSRTSQKITELLNSGKIRKLIPRVYTSNLNDKDNEIIRRNLLPIIAKLFPESTLSHRSAFEYNPSPLSNLYLTGKNRRVYKWPGVTLRFSKGQNALSDDSRNLSIMFQ